MLRSSVLGLRVRESVFRLVIKRGILCSATSSAEGEILTVNGTALTSLKVAELQQELVKRHLKKSGRKTELIERLEKVLQEERNKAASSLLVNGVAIDKLTIMQLRLHLFRRNLLSTGGRAEMTERLGEYVKTHTDQIQKTPQSSVEKRKEWVQELNVSPNISNAIYKAYKTPVRKKPVSYRSSVRKENTLFNQTQNQGHGNVNDKENRKPAWKREDKTGSERKENSHQKHAQKSDPKNQFHEERGNHEANSESYSDRDYRTLKSRQDIIELEFPIADKKTLRDRNVKYFIKGLTGFYSTEYSHTDNPNTLKVCVGKPNIENVEAKIKDLFETIIQHKKSSGVMEFNCPEQISQQVPTNQITNTVARITGCRISIQEKGNKWFHATGSKDDLMCLQKFINSLARPTKDQTRTVVFNMTAQTVDKLYSVIGTIQHISNCEIWLYKRMGDDVDYEVSVQVKGAVNATKKVLHLLKIAFGNTTMESKSLVGEDVADKQMRADTDEVESDSNGSESSDQED